MFTGGQVSTHWGLPQVGEGIGREGVSEPLAGHVRDSQPLLHTAWHCTQKLWKTKKTQIMQFGVPVLNKLHLFINIPNFVIYFISIKDREVICVWKCVVMFSLWSKLTCLKIIMLTSLDIRLRLFKQEYYITCYKLEGRYHSRRN